jgi:hypothetical protein
MLPSCLLQSTASEDLDHCPLLLGLRDLDCKGKNVSILKPFGRNLTVAAAWSSVSKIQLQEAVILPHARPPQPLGMKDAKDKSESNI